MDLTTTLIVLGLAAALAGFANYKTRRPGEPGRPSLVPYAGLQYVGLLLIVLMLAHLVTLLTGTPLVGRLSR